MGRYMGVLHLIYADDGWIAASGTRFWKKVLMWLFLYELLEIPITWKKVRGGAEVDWIGYHLDVATFSRGINESKRVWICNWIDSKLQQGGVVGRELKSVLGRLSFVAGALRHVRPFLAPLFSWSSKLAGGTFASFPDSSWSMCGKRCLDSPRGHWNRCSPAPAISSVLMQKPREKRSSSAAGRRGRTSSRRRHGGSRSG